MIAEMEPLYAKYDAFLTNGAGPAPRLDAHRAIGFTGKWQTPSMGTLATITGGPAIAVPCGFSEDGLPIGMQIIGRPLDEETVLRIAHTYEKATPWRDRRPTLTAGAAPTPITAGAEAAAAPVVDGPLSARVDMMARRAGLKLDSGLFAMLCEAAPHALAMASRIRRDFAWSDEPASVFRFPE
jgi:aspartyl-tRNA(Asn)/glutamyl-tRNA(Gln) amidotransferase subunit A